MKLIQFLMLAVLLFIISCTPNNEYKTDIKTDKNGYQYEVVTNDPMNARVYKLDNGLKVYLSQNADKPRIMTLIAVDAGSKNDPGETTGLAHYFEHIMFKGTDEIGTTNWEEESKILDQISDMFEKHKETSNPVEKLKIYAVIDSLSQEASKYAVANEYDKSVSILGAKYTNAFTNYEVTAYMNEIPSNDLDRWLMLEKERFEDPVLRLFHTELETVFEEYNMYQDYDEEIASKAMMEALFKNHPYKIDVIGKGEHLKNPSMVNIMKFKENYYVPNNMAICLMGDLDFEQTIKLIDDHWGTLEPNDNIPEFSFEPEKEITEHIEKEVFGPDKEFVQIGYRTPDCNSEEAKYLTLIDNILYNGSAGLIDINLVKNQKIQRAYAYYWAMIDYGIFNIVGYPRQDQSLEEVTNLLQQEIEKIKKGEFDDWMLEAVINNLKLDRIRNMDGNWAVFNFLDAFVSDVSWEDKVNEIEKLSTISKEELVKFANDFFKENYVVVKKRTGENKYKMVVDKPPLTPFDVNRNEESEYMSKFKKQEPEDIAPEFINFDEKINKDQLANGIDFYYTQNPSSELAYVYYSVDIGKNHIKKLPIAFKYLKYIGTDQYTLEDLSKEFYKIGISYFANSNNERSYVYLTGLDENIDKGLELLEHLLANAKADKDAYDKVVENIIKERENNKLDKWSILWDGMYNYAKYGDVNPTNDIVSEEELKNIDPQELIDLMKNVFLHEHRIFYYGTKSMDEAKTLISKLHNPANELKAIPEPMEYPELEYTGNKVFFCDYDMVQSQIIMLSKDKVFDPADLPEMRMFNEYYGGNMSSIVFQEMREAAGLAYGAYAGYNQPRKKGKSNYVFAFIGTQPDKIEIALNKFNDLLTEMPHSEKSFLNTKESVIKSINTERIIKDQIFWTYIRNQDLGINYDYREEVYNSVKNFTIDDVQKFFDENIKGHEYSYVVLGKKDKIDFNVLNKIGEVHELTLEEVFNY